MVNNSTLKDEKHHNKQIFRYNNLIVEIFNAC
jgi:hypothetical protein